MRARRVAKLPGSRANLRPPPTQRARIPAIPGPLPQTRFPSAAALRMAGMCAQRVGGCRVGRRRLALAVLDRSAGSWPGHSVWAAGESRGWRGFTPLPSSSRRCRRAASIPSATTAHANSEPSLTPKAEPAARTPPSACPRKQGQCRLATRTQLSPGYPNLTSGPGERHEARRTGRDRALPGTSGAAALKMMDVLERGWLGELVGTCGRSHDRTLRGWPQVASHCQGGSARSCGPVGATQRRAPGPGIARQ
jgi:hypothetical protein